MLRVAARNAPLEPGKQVAPEPGLKELPGIPPVISPRSWEVFMRSILLWAIGIPIPVIIILWLITGNA
jgi:hypothetical protein